MTCKDCGSKVLHETDCPLVRVTAARAAADTAGAIIDQFCNPQPPDTINRPPHYNHGTIEPIDVIEDWRLGFHEGNALKYIARAKHKGTEIDDLKKAAWYLNRAIERLSK